MANGGKIEFGVGFKTDISGLQKAKAELERIQNSTVFNVGMDVDSSNMKKAFEDLNKAKQAASELNRILDAAYSKDLGRINLSTFQNQLSKSSKSLQQMYTEMSSIGPVGERAFRNIATEVLTVNTQATKTTTILDKMADTMKKTIGWGISSSIMKNFSTSVQQAYGYVKDLDKSLNNIRIVSGQSAEEMGKFAQHANKTAKELGAATKEYADASLIYFQQGLNSQEATARTDTTIKMANVLGESAKEVSSYMTAIWNNFDDGSESLDHYGDVIVKLGASTASSAAEIAEGLEKFASVADTVGLSYEYATASLATVVAETRQSADIVGTAFKTLFARIEGLSLGETLEDGTDLNKYSKALEQVGINIKGQNGQLKQMDTILEELGAKWKLLSNDQQVALAQTVAGTRQYAQMVALMNNWDKVQQNVDVARGSNGTLEEQQEIYMESAQAHLKQLKTAWEDVYDSMFDPESIKTVADSLTFVVDKMARFIDAVGGGKGALLLLGSVATNVFSKQIAQGLGGIIINMKQVSLQAKEMKAQIDVANEFGKAQDYTSAYSELLSLVEKRNSLQGILTENQEKELNNTIKQINEINNEIEAQRELNNEKNKYLNNIGIKENGATVGRIKNETSKNIGNISNSFALDSLNTISNFDDLTLENGDAIAGMLDNIKIKLSNIEPENLELVKKFLTDEESNKLGEAIEKIKKGLENLDTNNLAEVQKAFENLNQDIRYVGETINQTTDNMQEGSNKAVKALKSAGNELEKLNQQKKALQGNYDLIISQAEMESLVQGFSKLTSGVSSTLVAVSSLRSAFSALEDDSLSMGEKTLRFLTSISMVLGSVITSFTTLRKSFKQIGTSYFNMAKTNVLANNTELKAKYDKAIEKERILAKEKILALEAKTTAELKDQAAIEAKKLAIEEEKKARQEVSHATNELDNIKKNHKRKKSWNKNADPVYLEALKKQQEAKEKLDKAKEAVTAADKAQTATTAALTVAIDAEEKATTKLAAAEAKRDKIEKSIAWNSKQNAIGMGAMAAAAAVAVVGVMAMVAALNHLEKVYHENLESLNKNIDKRNELRKKENEEIQANKETAKSYFDLYKQRQKNLISEEEFNETSKEYISTLGDEMITIENITNHYKDAAQALAEYNKIKNEGIIANSESAIAELKNKAENNRGLNSHWYEDIFGFKSIEGFISGEGDNDFIKTVAKDAALNAGVFSRIPVIGGLIAAGKTIGDINKLDKEQRQREEEKIDNFNSLSDLNEYRRIKKLQAVGSTKELKKLGYDEELIKELDQQWEQKDQATLQNLLSDAQFSKDSKKIEETFYNAIKSKDIAMSEKDAYDYLLQEASSSQNKTLNKFAQEQVKARGLAERRAKDEDKKKEIRNDPEFLTKEENQQYLDAVKLFDSKNLKNAYSSMSDDDWEEFFNLDSYEEKAKKAEEIAKKYSNQIKEKWQRDNGIDYTKTLNDFYAESSAEGYGVSELRANKEKKDSSYNKIMAEKDTLIEMYPELEDAFEILNQEHLAGTEKWLESLEEISQYQAQMALDENQRAIETTEVKINEQKKVLKEAKMSGDKNDIETAKAELDDLLSELDTLKANKKNILEIEIKADENKLKDLGGDLKNLKSSYKSLKDVVNDYNSDHRLSIENLDVLLNLNTEYLSCIKMENGQMSINASAYKEIMKQKVLDAQATVMQTAQDRLRTLAAKEAGEESVKQSYLAAMATERGSEAAEAAAAGWDKYWASVCKGFNILPEFQKEADAIGEWAQASLQNLGDIYKNIDSMSLDKVFADSSAAKSKKDYDVNPFEKIDKVINKVTHSLEKLQKQESKTFGVDLLNNLKAQDSVLKAQNKSYEKKLELQKEEAQILKNNLLGAGATFDADGNLNYNEFMVGITNAYNSGTMTDEQYDKYKKWADNYVDIWENAINETENAIQDNLDKIIENNIKIFKIKVELELDLNEAQRKYNDWYNDIAKDFDKDSSLGKATLALENALTYFNKDGTGDINALLDQQEKYNKEFADIQEDNISSVYGDDNKKLVEDMKKNTEQLMDSMKKFKSEVENAQSAYLSSIDKMKSSLDGVNQAYNNIIKNIEHAKSLTTLLFGDKAYGQMEKYFQKIIKNQKDQTKQLKQSVDYWAQMAEDALESGDNEAYEKYIQNYNDALTNLNSTVDSLLNNITESYSNKILDIIDKFNKSLSDGLTLDEVQNEWKLINKASSMYLDDMNKSFEITKLQAKYQKEINNTTNVAIQQRLTKVMNQQVKALREKQKITEYDVKLANLRYDIALKEKALEDARNSKTNLRLSRDSQGNYNYVYGQDEDALDKAKEELDQARMEAYNLSKQQFLSNQQNFSTEMSNYQKEAQDIVTNKNYSKEEKKKKLDELNVRYQQIIAEYAKQNEDIQKDLVQEIMDLNGVTQEEAEKQLNTLIPEIGSSTQKMIDEMNESGFDSLTENLTNNLMDASEEYNTAIKEALEDAGLKLEDIKNGTVDANTTLANDLTHKDEQAQQASDELEATKEIYKTLKDQWEKFKNSDLYKKAVSAIQTAEKNLKSLLEDINENAKIIDYSQALKDIEDAIGNIKLDTSSVNKDDNDGENEKTPDNLDINSTPRKAVRVESGKTDNTYSIYEKEDTGTYKYFKEIAREKLEDYFKDNNYGYDAYYDDTVNNGNGWLKNDFGSYAVYDQDSEYNPYYKNYEITVDKNKKKYTLYKGGVEVEGYADKDIDYADEVFDYYNTIKGTNIPTKSKEEAKEEALKAYFEKHYSKNKYLRTAASKYDTGGYTGEWDSSGRLAVLHQKELVLNQKDTKNILEAVEISRKMASIIDSINSNVDGALFEAMNKYNKFINGFASKPNDTSGNVNQEILIQADFSGLHDARELENAFNNLANKAGQYAYKTT